MNTKSACKLTLVLLVCLVLASCRMLNRGRSDTPTPTAPAETQALVAAPSPTVGVDALSFHTGRNDYTVDVDGYPREFIVYVPASYDASQPAPLVFMFHGSNQGGPLMYENTR